MYLVKDMNTSINVAGWLRNNTDWTKAIDSVKQKYPNPIEIKLKIEDFYQEKILGSINEALEIYGDYGWRYISRQSKIYSGFSLMYNPDLIDSVNDNIHSSSLGTDKLSAEEVYNRDYSRLEIIKNTYFDSFGFNIPTPASQHKFLGEFLSRSKAQGIRSRLAILNGNQFRLRNKFGGWHHDESIFENLRINIPIETGPEYFFQIQDQEPKHLDVGYAYSWDATILHRVFMAQKNNNRRIHLVLGFSPWWNYDSNIKGWYKNEFYGIKHPFDMLIEGDILSGLTLLEQ